jgi:CheY-like chemotaxis protein
MSEAESGARVVLVVEDNPTNMMLIRAVLQRAGFHVESAASAEDAEQWLESYRPAVILMDVQLPGRDGLSFTRSLRDQSTTADIPIVALTAHAMLEDRERALAAGCNAYIAKPINTRTLAQELDAILAHASVAGSDTGQAPHA